MPIRDRVWEWEVYLWPLFLFQGTWLQFCLGVADELNSSTVVSVGLNRGTVGLVPMVPQGCPQGEHILHVVLCSVHN